jgi:hypothetical protein
MKIKVKVTKEIDVQYIEARCGVRYWEDGKVNGVEDTDGLLIPLRRGQYWCPTIKLKTGKILDWPEGTTAKIHYKVCDDGAYWLLDGEKNRALKYPGDYVPNIMSPNGYGDGDYVVMHIGPDGVIEKWDADLSAFEEEDTTNV